MAKKKGEQQELPGVLPDVADFPDVTRAAKKCKELRKDWQELGAKVAKAKDALAEKMHEHGIKTYVAEGLRVELVDGKELVKIKEISQEEDEAV